MDPIQPSAPKHPTPPPRPPQAAVEPLTRRTVGALLDAGTAIARDLDRARR